MRNAALIAVGIVAMVAGAIFALQGFGVIGGSFMSGNSAWAIAGPVVAVAGIILIALGWRRSSAIRQ